MDCLVRPITQEDVRFLWEMLYQAIYVADGVASVSRDALLRPEIRRYLQNWGRPHDSGFLAVDSETLSPLGAVWLRLLISDEKGYGYVDDATPELTIAVVPEFRGNGIGTRLLSHLIKDTESRYPSLSLSVSPDNPALRLYQRLGFKAVGMCGTSLVMKRGQEDTVAEALDWFAAAGVKRVPRSHNWLSGRLKEASDLLESAQRWSQASKSRSILMFQETFHD